MCLAFNEKLEKNGNTSLSFRCNVQAPAPFALYGKDRCASEGAGQRGCAPQK